MSSMNIDPQGKSYAQQLLEYEIPVDDELFSNLNKTSSLFKLFSKFFLIFLKQGILLFFVLSEKINILPLAFNLFLARFRRRFKFFFEKK